MVEVDGEKHNFYVSDILLYRSFFLSGQFLRADNPTFHHCLPVITPAFLKRHRRSRLPPLKSPARARPFA